MSVRFIRRCALPLLGVASGIVLGAAFQGCECVPYGEAPQAPVLFEIVDAPLPDMVGGTVLLVDDAKAGFVEVRWGTGENAKLVRYDRLDE